LAAEGGEGGGEGPIWHRFSHISTATASVALLGLMRGG
jgi:hypothetical protein